MDGDVWPLAMKRLLPVLTSVVGVSDELQAYFPAAAAEAAEEQAEPAEDEFEGVETPHARAARIAMPLAQRLAQMSDADGKFIARLGIAWHVIGEKPADMFSRLGLDMNAYKAMLPPGFNG